MSGQVGGIRRELKLALPSTKKLVLFAPEVWMSCCATAARRRAAEEGRARRREWLTPEAARLKEARGRREREGEGWNAKQMLGAMVRW